MGTWRCNLFVRERGERVFSRGNKVTQNKYGSKFSNWRFMVSMLSVKGHSCLDAIREGMNVAFARYDVHMKG